MNLPTLIIEKKHHISIIKINREKQLNSINKQVLLDLDTTLNDINNDKTQKILIITGAGHKSFAAGADIKEMQTMSPKQATSFSKLGHKIFNTIENMQIPVIAAVNGFTLGGGLELALSCDFIYSNETAIFGLVETSLGLIPGFGGLRRLKRQIGLNYTKELCFFAKKINAQEALKIKLINKIYKNNVLTETIKQAENIINCGPLAITLCKQILNIDTYNHFYNDTLTELSFNQIFASEDKKEGINAFIQKRKVFFKGY